MTKVEKCDMIVHGKPDAGLFFLGQPSETPSGSTGQPELNICLDSQSRALGVKTLNGPALWFATDGSPEHGTVRFMATSKLQEETKKRIRLLLAGKRFIENYRPDWLKNPDTSANLELDFWLPEIDVAIEVQGDQHFEFVPIFHGTVEKFYAQLQRDALKKVLCQKRGVTLYEVCSPEDIDTFIESAMRQDSDLSEWLHTRNHAIKALVYMAAELVRLPKKPKTRSAALSIADRRESLLSRMINIAQQHNIPLNAIEPDFTVKKQEMIFPGCARVTILRFNSDGKMINGAKAALIYAKGGLAHLKWFKRRDGRCHFKEMDFDIKTGWQVPEDDIAGRRWQLQVGTLPDDLEEIPVFTEGQRVIWHGSDPNGKHDFDLPTEALVLETSTKSALLQIETRSGLYKKWVDVRELEIPTR